MPNRQYYGSAPNAFAGGRLFGQDQRKRQHQENALNELIERFGPEAGDPTAWSQLQDIDHDAQRFPHELERLEHQKKLRPYEIGRLEHERNLQPYEIGRLEHERNLQPIDLETAQRGNAAGQALVEQYGVRAGDTAAWGQAQAVGHNAAMFPHKLGAMERETEAFEANVDNFGPAAGNPAAHGIEQEELERLRGAASAAAHGIQYAMQNGGDVLAAYDRAAINVLPHLNLPPEAIAGWREAIAENPEAAGEIVAMILRGLNAAGGTGTGTGVRGLSGGRAFRDPETGEIVYGIPMSDGSVQVARDEQGRPMQPVAEELAERRVEQGGERIEQGWERITLEAARMEGFNAPEGHQIERNPETGEMRAWPIPGTAQAREVEATERRLTAEEHDERKAAEDQVQISILALNALANTEAQMERWKMFQGGSGVLGRVTRITGGLPGVQAFTDVGRYKEEVQTLLAHIAIDRLVTIKDSGATLGQITAPELAMLRSSMGNLEAVGRDPALIQRDLDKIREILTAAGNRAKAALEMDLRYPSGGGQAGAGGTSPPPQGSEDPELEDILRLYGPGGGR